MNTYDSYTNCPSFKNYCSSKSFTFSDGKSIASSCPRTCNTFSGLKCKNSTYLCSNGGTCSNILFSSNKSIIAFKCNCPIGFTGFLCSIRKYIFKNFILIYRFKALILKANPCALKPCKNNSYCQQIGSLGKYVCINGLVLNETTSNIPSTTDLIVPITSTVPITTPSSSPIQNLIETTPKIVNSNKNTIVNNVIQLKVSFNANFLTDYLDLTSVASQKFISNFKSFVN